MNATTQDTDGLVVTPDTATDNGPAPVAEAKTFKIQRPRCKGCGKHLANKIYNRQAATRCSKCRNGGKRVRNKRVTHLRRLDAIMERQVNRLVRAEQKRLKPIVRGLRAELIGQEYAAAVMAAKMNGFVVRVFKRDGVDEPLSKDIDLRRINVSLTNGLIDEVLLG